MRTTTTIAALLLAVMAATAQSQYDAILEQIERNSTTMSALRQQMDAQQLGNSVGLTPTNPEVELGYLWGAPSAIGDRKDASIKQTFDFPTVYAQRRRLAQARDKGAEWEYRTRRAALLLAAKRLCIETTYYNALLRLYDQQRQRAARIVESYESKMASGEANIIERNKAAWNLAAVAGEADRASQERNSRLSELAGLNGGTPIAMDCCEYEPATLPADFSGWYAQAEAEAPALAYLKAMTEADDRQVGLSRAASLPQWSVGYMGEFTRGQDYQGITFGISIPLWENRNRTRHAKAVATASRMMAEDARVQHHNRMRSLYDKARTLLRSVNSYAETFAKHDNDALLYKAYESGELSLLDYLLEADYYLSTIDKWLQTQRDLALTVAELEAYKL